MKKNLNLIAPDIYELMLTGEKLINSFSFDPKLCELIRVRVSQINCCGYCLDMHTRKAVEAGEHMQRIFTLPAWWETNFFTEEEQVALKLAEEVTRISNKGLSEQTHQKALSLFGEKKFFQLIFIIIMINNWNRIAISTRLVPEKLETNGK